MADFSTYIQDVTTRSDELRKTLVDPFRVEDGTFMIPKSKAEAEERNRILESAAKNSIFEMAGKSAPMIAGVWARALQGYEVRHKRQPSADLLASAHKAMENMLNLSNSSTAPGIFNGINMSSTVGIQTRDCAISLVLPTYLTMISSNMVTYILGDFYKCDFFRIAFDVDIEKTPTQLPKIVYDTPSRVLYPHCAAFKDVTIQNIWRVCRESSQNLDSLAMQILLNSIAADKDHKHLYDMYRFCPEEGVICKSKNKHFLLTESYETIKALRKVDNKLMMATGVAGLSGIVAGVQACNVFRYLPSTNFEVAQGYRFTSQPHYVGKLFGSIDLYCDPHAPDTWSCLCYAKGRDYGQAAYVVGDAIPSLAFNQSIMEDLERSSIIGELAYHDMQPFDGARYLCKLTFTTSE